VTIYCFKKFNESPETLGRRLATDIRLGNNRDGDAVDVVSRKFENSRLRQVMIVISDGQPAASSYSGEAANRHAASVVKKIRQRRIDVLSISITPSAQANNDKIYGAEWNVKNDDVNVIEDVIRRLIQK
jgi:nitric oxide reductase activation protein